MKEINADFIMGAVSAESFPKGELQEIAFAGRSNVGKSSLLNSLVLRKKLAKISATPGKTQQINFFKTDMKWMFADLPGYGYASASKDNRIQWHALNEIYINTRENLALVCLLVDSRHDPMDSDIAMMEHLESINRKFAVILTKSDKISSSLGNERVEQLKDLLKYCTNLTDVLLYSSKTNLGRPQLIAIIRKAVGLAEA